MIMMAVGDGDRIHIMSAGLAKPGHSFPPLPLRMHPGVEQNAIFVQFHQPCARPDVRTRIQIQNIHDAI